MSEPGCPRPYVYGQNVSTSNSSFLTSKTPSSPFLRLSEQYLGLIPSSPGASRSFSELWFEFSKLKNPSEDLNDVQILTKFEFCCEMRCEVRCEVRMRISHATFIFGTGWCLLNPSEDIFLDSVVNCNRYVRILTPTKVHMVFHMSFYMLKEGEYHVAFLISIYYAQIIHARAWA